VGDEGREGGEALDTWEMKGMGGAESTGDGENMGEEEEHGTGKKDWDGGRCGQRAAGGCTCAGRCA